MDYGLGGRAREGSDVYEANLADLVRPPVATLSSPSAFHHSRPLTTTHDHDDYYDSTTHPAPPSTASFRTALEQPSRAFLATTTTEPDGLTRLRQSLPTPPHRPSYDDFVSSPSPARYSYPYTEPSSRSGRDLPVHSHWDPAWQSGGYTASGSNSHEGRGFTHHPPPPSSYAPTRTVAARQYEYPYPVHSSDLGFRRMGDGTEREEEEEDQGYGWMPDPPIESEFKGLAGEYKHGVGFANAGSSLSTKDSRKVAERLRRLEKEFGAHQVRETEKAMSMKERIERAKAERKREKRELIERSGVDSKGRLVVMGSRKRAASRWIQGLGAFGVGLGSIGAALFTKPAGTPPPKHHLSIWLLYLLPFLSLGTTIYFFLFKPYCSRNRQQISPHSPHHNQMVIPILGSQNLSNASGCCCLGGRNQSPKNAQRQQQQGATVNLLLDPVMLAHLTGGTGQPNNDPNRNFTSSHEKDREKRRRKRRRRRRHRRRKADEKDLEGGSSSSSPSESSLSSDESDAWSINDSPSGQQRKGILSGIALEGRWREARKALRKVAFVDGLWTLFWFATVGWAVGWGGSCKPGAFEGYCNFYNSAVACSAFVATAFLASVVFDCLDLRRTRAPPRLRQQRLR